MADLRKHRKFKRPVGSPLQSPLVSPITDMDAAGGNASGEMKVVFGRFSQRLAGARTNVIVTNFKKFSQHVVAAEEVSASVAVSFFKETKMTFGHEGFVSNWVEAIGPARMTLGTGRRSIDGALTTIKFSEQGSGHVVNGSTGHISQHFKKLSVSASGEAQFAGGTMSVRFKKLKQNAEAFAASVLGRMSTSFPRAGFLLKMSAAGYADESGAIAVRFKKLSQSAAGSQSPEFGTISTRFKKIVLNEQAREKFVGSIDGMLFKTMQQHVDGMVFNGARVVVRFPGSISMAAAGWDSAVGSSHIIFPKFGTAASGGQGKANGHIAETFKLFEQQVLVGAEEFAQVAQTFPLMVTSGFVTVGSLPQEEDMIPQGRLTLTTGVPYITSDTTGASTIYYTPAIGNKVPLWNGSDFASTAFSEISQALSDTSKSPAAAASNSVYDLFIWNDSGTVRVSRGPAWSSNTDRGTGAGTSELQMVNGMLVNKNAITNGPAAGFGTYVGTIATDGSTTINMQFAPAAASGGPAAKMHLWNMYNRRKASCFAQDTSALWSYTSTTVRPANNSSNNSISVVQGIVEETVHAEYFVNTRNKANTTGQVATYGIGVDSTTAFVANGPRSALSTNYSFSALNSCGPSSWEGAFSAPGLHTIYALESGLSSGQNSYQMQAGAGEGNGGLIVTMQM